MLIKSQKKAVLPPKLKLWECMAVTSGQESAFKCLNPSLDHRQDLLMVYLTTQPVAQRRMIRIWQEEVVA
jgi:hypothetical protein